MLRFEDRFKKVKKSIFEVKTNEKYLCLDYEKNSKK